jgi:hypothetical protein
MAFFDIVLRTSGSLHPGGDPDDFISTHTCVIRCTRDRDGKVFKVGRVKAYRIHAGLAPESGESVFDVCDAHSQEMGFERIKGTPFHGLSMDRVVPTLGDLLRPGM